VAFTHTIAEDEAAGDVAELYGADRQALGYVANYTKTFSLRPEVMRGWQQLNGAVKSGMDLRRYELATLAAARRLRSSYCALAHGKILAEKFLPPETVGDAARDPASARLDPVDLAVMALADKVAADAPSITEADLAPLRDLGFSDTEVLDVILAAAARCFFSTVLDATGTEPDAALSALEGDLRRALTVGRSLVGE
jgi:uncharacterized peroxidase-related enzyme